MSHFFIDRPIVATVMLTAIFVVVTLTGFVAIWTLLTPPRVLVTAIYPGANAQTVRDAVGAPIEAQVTGVEGMMDMSPRCSNDGAYNLIVTFKLGIDSDMAQVLVQNRVSLALPILPTVVQNEGISVMRQRRVFPARWAVLAAGCAGVMAVLMVLGFQLRGKWNAPFRSTP